MKNTITMNSRRFGAYTAKSYFVTVTRHHNKTVQIRFVNDAYPVEECELTIETDVIVNIATAVLSDGCTNYQLNVRDGKIANHDKLSVAQRVALLETRLGDSLLGEKIPVDITDKNSSEPFYTANTKITKDIIRDTALRHIEDATQPNNESH